MSDKSYAPPPYHYVAFIDEAGDPGISRVRPLDPVGGSEWLVIGATVMEARREERITDYCYRHSMRFFGKPRRVKIIFSQRGGHSYGHTITYSEILKQQSRSETTYLDKRTINWQTVDLNLFEVLEHRSNAGLQLADIVASSFYQAVDLLPPTEWNPAYAKLLKPRVATENLRHQDYGVAFQPTPPYRASLLKKQKEIFEFYGYDGRDFYL
jgi:Protein of unknown function (DUF3800)